MQGNRLAFRPIFFQPTAYTYSPQPTVYSLKTRPPPP